MNDTNIIIAALGGGRTTVTASRFMEDYGQVLKITGVELPDVYQVDFANSPHDGNSVTMVGNADGVLIPRQFFDTGRDVYAFLYLTRDGAGRTMATIRIPNKRRPKRTDETPNPEEQSVIDQTIAALNTAVEKTAADVETTAQNVTETDQNATRAEQARDRAEAAATSAETSATNASQSEANASASASTATAAATSASASAASAATNADRAEQAAAQSGYMFFYIDENGDLRYQRTDNVDVDFYLNDGDLYVRAGA
jgi:hypothetical protein